jgi:cell division protein FtsL
MRVLNFAAFFFALASAFLLYSLNYDTRRLEASVQDKEQAASRARSDIAVLKAEKSHLSRPERIDSYARAQGLGPPRPDQMGNSGRIATFTGTINEEK